MKRVEKIRVLGVLLIMFAASAALNYVIWMHFQRTLGESAHIIRKEIIQVHSVLIGIVIGGLVAGSGREKVRRPLALAAVGVSTGWILYVVSTWHGYPQTIGANGPDGLINSFNDRATDLAPLVSGTLAYLCQKRSDGISAVPPE